MRLLLRRLPALGGLQLFALLCAMMAATQSLYAVTITVTTTADSGAGSLRAAIAAANDFDTIQFDPALNGQTIMVTSGTITITTSITINGLGADQLTVKKPSGAPEYHIFSVNRIEIVRINGLTIDGNDTTGAAIWSAYSRVTIDRCVVQGCRHYGGISSICFGQFEPNAHLQVSNSIIRNNYADAAGGGIYSSSVINCIVTLTIINSVVSNNTAGSFGNASGGGIYNNGDMDILNSIVSDNVSGGNSPDGPFGNGGGISKPTGALFISACTISGNSAGLNGGGVYNTGPFAHIDDSTVSGNSTTGINELEGWGEGAGIYNGGQLEITNCTLSNNNSTRSGGAASNRGSLTIRHSTLSGNNGFKGGTIANYNGATVQIGNTALKVSTFSPSISNISGTITSNGYNLINDNGGGFLTAPGDQTNTEPMLGPLQNNGGPTFTHELLTGSPAIDAGNPSFTPPPSNDQRGPPYQRVFNGRIDIGSLEVQPAPPTPTPSATPSPTVTATASPSPTATPTPTATATATASPTPTATPNPTAPAQSLNLSSRMLVQTGDRVGIAGLIISGGAPKRVIVRAVHCMICIPEVFPLLDPVLELHGPNGFATIINDNWRDAQEAEIIATGLAPDNNSDPAIVVTLPPGNYTAVVRGKNNTSGVAVVEVYDLNQAAASKLANISTRAFVGTGGDILIAGFILGNGTMPDNIIIRGIGPSLAGLGVPDALANPTLELRDSHGALIRSNDNWMDDPAQRALIMAAGLAPTNPLESAMAETLPPGQYTALLAGVNNGTGNGLVEVYDRVGQP
ncbi:MAG: hypothetical protein QOC70_360 [Verrucomicrobiota bacterium]